MLVFLMALALAQDETEKTEPDLPQSSRETRFFGIWFAQLHRVLLSERSLRRSSRGGKAWRRRAQRKAGRLAE